MAEMPIFLVEVKTGVVKTEEGGPPSSPGITEADWWISFLI